MCLFQEVVAMQQQQQQKQTAHWKKKKEKDKSITSKSEILLKIIIPFNISIKKNNKAYLDKI